MNRNTSFHHCLGIGAAIRRSEFREWKMAEQRVSSIELTLSRKFTLRPNKRVSIASTVPPKFDFYPEQTSISYRLRWKEFQFFLSLSLSLSFHSPAPCLLSARRTGTMGNFMSLLREMRSTANLFHGQLPFGRWALCIANSPVTRYNCRDIGVGWRALPPDIGYRLRAPRPFRTRRILQAGWMLLTVINYGRTLNSTHGIRDPHLSYKPLHADPYWSLDHVWVHTACPKDFHTNFCYGVLSRSCEVYKLRRMHALKYVADAM